MPSPPTNATAPVAPKKPRQGRSPAFPFIPVAKALERAEQLRMAEGGRPKHFTPWNAVAKAWELGEKTGPMKQTMAAMGYFGLFEFEGRGDQRSARLTDIAFKILLDKQPVSPERDQLIRQVAFTPGAHKDLQTKWPDGLPSDPTVETYLVRDRNFSEEGAKDLIAEYKATLAFAKGLKPATLPDKKPVDELPNQRPELGDLVQVVIGGALTLEKPKRIRAIRDHEGTQWVFVEDHEAGVPMDQIEVVEKGSGGGKAAIEPPRLPLTPKDEDDAVEKPGSRVSRFALKEGDVIIRFPDNMSLDSVEDLDGFWQVFIKKARREAGTN